MLRRLMGIILRFIVVTPANKTTADELIAELDATGTLLSEHFHNAADTAKNRQQLAHIVGIERWGVSRMKTVFGGELVAGEYDTFRPVATRTVTSLAGAFDKTRADTLALARRAQAEGQFEATAPHNDMGDISIKAWLYYLSKHATREAKRVK